MLLFFDSRTCFSLWDLGKNKFWPELLILLWNDAASLAVFFLTFWDKIVALNCLDPSTSEALSYHSRTDASSTLLWKLKNLQFVICCSISYSATCQEKLLKLFKSSTSRLSRLYECMPWLLLVSCTQATKY
jgi:hypothetical protein